MRRCSDELVKLQHKAPIFRGFLFPPDNFELLLCDTQEHGHCTVHAYHKFSFKPPERFTELFPRHGDRFINHHLRPFSQLINLVRLDGHSK
jgi:hypothetical protein